MSSLLELKKVYKRFGPLQILSGVDLSLEAGDTVAILGPSGAGKSTLLHVAGLMEKPTEGDVIIDGAEAHTLKDYDMARLRLNTLGFLFQFHHLLPDFDVLENVLIPARLAGDELGKKEQEARELLNRLGLSARLTHRPHQLSGGEQQRAALARALIRNPKLLLCDEPTGNLDQTTAQEMMAVIWGEVRSRRLAMVMVTHNERLAASAGKSYHLQNGDFTERKLERV